MSTKTSRLPFFAVSPPGLESITQRELFNLGINHPRAVSGGVEFEGFLNHLYRVNLWSRTASRVLVRVGEFEAKSFAELERKAEQIEWGNFLKGGVAINVRATCHKSKLYHSDGVAERVANAIKSQVGENKKSNSKLQTSNLQSPISNLQSQLVVARLDHDHCTISLDSSGDHLHQRGYRLETAKAPLRENIAAALLLQAKYDPSLPLIDPFCGSGTFPIEAAMMARKIAPGLNRKFSFTHWKNFDTQAWGDLLRETKEKVDAKITPKIFASDRDAGAIEAATANAERAGVAESIQWRVCAFSSIEVPNNQGLVISNLPYGKRVGEDSDLRNLYAQLGNVAREKLKGWRLALLTDDPQKIKAAALDLNITLKTENGGVRVALLENLQGV
ncbi:MAG: class I SAM-dependent RNA methyltransferase [Chloroflexi bacterium]|nr:class I SAM-dependent RNA methyltransferase [Chloroflexota bacterium]MBI5080278.1 class I SAM-dependent RNA methyltransferase [Chloroflexota bacterium]MBI5349745.1 class I SAM-dependent RNA methyltransferase [Chloroflexota bacterium]